MTETINLNNDFLSGSVITIDKLADHIEKMYKHNLNLFMWGNPGIGKTDAVKQFVAKQRLTNPDFKSYYLTLAHMDPTDLSGLPMFIEKDGVKITSWATPEFLPRDPNAVGVMFLDEYNNASGAVQNACQQLIQERRIGNYHLPDGIFIIAAGNPEGQNNASTQLSAPTKNRFAHVLVKTTLDAWQPYFLRQNYSVEIKQLILGFLKHNPKFFEDENAMNANSYTFATPRSWNKVAELLSDNLDSDRETIALCVSQYMGAEIGNAFASYKEDSERYQNPLEIIDGKEFTCGHDIVGFYSTMYGVIATLFTWLEQKEKVDGIAKGISNLFKATQKLKDAGLLTATATMVVKSGLISHTSIEDMMELAPVIKAARTRN